LFNKTQFTVKIFRTLIFNLVSLNFRRQYFGGSSKLGCMEKEPPSEVAGLPLALLKMMQVNNNLWKSDPFKFLQSFPHTESMNGTLLCS